MMVYSAKGRPCDDEPYDGTTKWDTWKGQVPQTLDLTTKLQEI